MALEILRWAERFIATPSVSRDGNERIAALGADLLRAIGLEPRLRDATQDGVVQRNVLADAGPARDGGLLLVTHLDTVPPGDPARWTATGGDPFHPTRDGDRLYGLGSADAKVDLVCKAAALERVGPSRLRRRVRIAGTFGEEIGMLGARALVAGGETRDFAQALVGEPSELAAIVAHKGYAVFEAALPRVPGTSPGADAPRVVETFDGVAAHSSAPALGKNALEAALDRACAPDVAGVVDFAGGEAVNQVPDRCRLELVRARPGAPTPSGVGYPRAPLDAFRRAWRAFLDSLGEPRDPSFDPDHTVASLGRVVFREGRPVFGFDVRPVPGVDPLAAVAALEDVCELVCVRRNPALAPRGRTPLVEAVAAAQRAIGLGESIGSKATCTEAGVLAEAGLDALVLGAGTSVGNVHRPNEHTRVTQLEQAVSLYAHALERLCVGVG
jgi:succinyl-diaminopimelate desuccinylase